MQGVNCFNLSSNDQVNSLLQDFYKGTAYTTFDRATFSYRGEREGSVIVKQKPRSKPKDRKQVKREKSVSRSRVRWAEVRKRCLSFFHLPSSKRYATFVTISFPAGLSDKNCRKCLNTWFTRVRSIRPRLPYLWVAERQKNGTLHFHILTNQFLPIKLVNRFMAIAINGVRNDQPAVFKNWKRDQYNGVDIKSVRNIRALKGYLTKYMTKNETQIEGSPWHCSRLFSNLATTICMHPVDIADFIRRICASGSIEPSAIRVVVTEHSATFLMPTSLPRSWLVPLVELNCRIEKAVGEGKSGSELLAITSQFSALRYYLGHQDQQNQYSGQLANSVKSVDLSSNCQATLSFKSNFN